jgi:hypothetical protein
MCAARLKRNTAEFESSELADAVLVKPVSTLAFPANREKNREFCKIAISRPSETL